MLISRNLHVKSSEVSIKTRSTPASLSFKGQATKHTTVKCAASLVFGCLSHCLLCCFLPSSGVTVGISVSVVLFMINTAVFIAWMFYRRIQKK